MRTRTLSRRQRPLVWLVLASFLLQPVLSVASAEASVRLEDADSVGRARAIAPLDGERLPAGEAQFAAELPTDLKLPTQNLSELGRSTEFWRALGTQTGAEIIVSGSLEFRVEDRSGYKTEEYVSPIDGRTYYRQVYVEQTGFLFDIVFLVFDGRSGEKILQDEFKDFRQTGGRRADELQGLFENLFSLENQILNLFVARDREAERYIFTD